MRPLAGGHPTVPPSVDPGVMSGGQAATEYPSRSAASLAQLEGRDAAARAQGLLEYRPTLFRKLGPAHRRVKERPGRHQGRRDPAGQRVNEARGRLGVFRVTASLARLQLGH